MTLARIAPFVIICASFGPYVMPAVSVRLEQIVVYPLISVLCILYLASAMRLNGLPATYLTVFGLLWSIAATQSYFDAVPAIVILAGMDNLVLSVSVTFVLCISLREEAKHGTDAMICHVVALLRFVCCLLALHCIVELLQLTSGLSPYLKAFWSGDTLVASGRASVGAMSLTMGRMTGIFNQPAENGIAYSSGLFAWYVVFGLTRTRTLDYVLLPSLVLGGTLAVSKVFLLGGLPLFLGLVLADIAGKRPIGRRVFGLVATAMVAVTCMTCGISTFAPLQEWQGLETLLKNLNAGSNVFVSITAGRIGGEGRGSLMELVSLVADRNILLGGGFGFLPLQGRAIDSAYVEVFMLAGLIGVGMYLSLLCLILKAAILARGDARLRRAYVAFAVFLIGAGVGMPVFTSNRASTILLTVFWAVAFTASTRRIRTESESRIANRCGGDRPYKSDHTSRVRNAEA